MASTTPLSIAVLVNTPPGNEFWHDVRQSWTDAFNAVAPGASVEFYDPVHKFYFPGPRQYNRIVLSGGKADAPSSDPWVLGVLSFVRATAILQRQKFWVFAGVARPSREHLMVQFSLFLLVPLYIYFPINL
jgi:hypothetical protein